VETKAAKRKPPNVVYTVDEAPPALVTALNGLQHVGLISIFLVYPLLVFRVADVPLPLVGNLLAIGLLVLGIGTWLQTLRRGPLGSGFMCPSTFTGVYLGPSLLAVKLGGLPMLFGMTVFAGALEIALSRLLDRMRPIFPPELSGLIIFMVGWGGGIAGLRTMIGAEATPLRSEEFWVSAVTLFTMVALNVWATGMLRMLCALVGLLVGYAAAAALDLFEGRQFAVVVDAPWIGLPSFSHVSWSFDAALALPFAFGCVAVAMKAVGTITICQRMNDADWVRPDMESARRGVLADGVATVVAGGMGALGTNTSTPSVGLASATGVGSRHVAYAVAILFVLLGLTPKLTASLAVMPRSVMIAALLFAVSFIIINGLQVMTSRLLDARRTLVIGLAIVAGGAVEVFPQLAASAPKPIASLVASSLAFSTLIALSLNFLFRIGIKKTVTLSIDHSDIDPEKVEKFLKSNGAIWGARPEVVSRATFGVIQLLDAVRQNCWESGPIEVSASFDEFNLDVRASYAGEPLEFPVERPSNRDIVLNENGARLLAGFMLRRCADRVRAESKNGRATLHLHYDH
jgi:NCS2 family nucleobase:cation symporter-2